jgi:hypothetical protein
MPGYMKVNLAVDGILRLFAEFYSLESGYKSNPIGPGRDGPSSPGRFPLRRQAAWMAGCALALIQLHISLLSLHMDGKQIIDIRYLQTLAELLVGNGYETVHLAGGTWG